MLRIALILVAIVLLGPFLVMAFAVPMMVFGGGMMGSASGVFGLFGVLLQVVWLVVVIGAVVLGYRWLVGRDRSAPEPALEELRIAYARGDITGEEFEERRTVLMGT